MKGLDFTAAGALQPAESEEDEGGSEEDAEDDEDGDEEEFEGAAGPAVPAASVNKETKAAPALSIVASAAPNAPVDPTSTSATQVPATSTWPDLLPPLSPIAGLAPLPPFKLQGLRSRAEGYLRDLPPLGRKTSSADAAFISQVLSSGTHQDKLAALILLVRESPIHAVKELTRLRGMTGYKEDVEASEAKVGGGSGGNKDQRVAVCRALVDWWVSGGGKASGKLRYVEPRFEASFHPEVNEDAEADYGLATLQINQHSAIQSSRIATSWSLPSRIF